MRFSNFKILLFFQQLCGNEEVEMKMLIRLLTCIECAVFYVLIVGLTTISTADAAVIANDGGITLWVSYDNLDTVGADIDDPITEANSLPGGFSCDVTNAGRADVGSPNSPPSCPGGAGPCTGRDKITGDLEKLADYIFDGSEGAHYLRRVYVSDNGRAWNSADIKWNVGVGGSSAPGGGWANSDSQMNLQSAYRTCIHDVAHHELGHYIYNLPDRYERADGYFRGTIGGSAPFDVDVTGRDINTVMSNNFPHLFVDTTNAQITVDYDQPGPGTTTGEVLTPGLLTDADTTNDGPNRAHHNHTMPFAQDEWSLLPTRHADLSSVHTEGTFSDPGVRPDVDIVFIGDEDPHPGTVLLLDRSGSMGVTTNGITAAQFVQEAGMFLYHSSEPADIVGTYLYNASVEELFPYAAYDSTNDLPFASFRTASGLTNIAEALETAIDTLIDTHGEGGVNGAEIYLMSDGRQTTGASLWDQVTRANELGIRINTFSFGNADSTTMDSIATGTSGSTTTMSERDDAAELKMLMTRKFSTGRGKTPVFSYKGKMEGKINLGSTQVYIGQFEIPPKSNDLQFYIFLHSGDSSRSMVLSLESPDGVTIPATAPDNVATKGRFNGIKVEGPKAGLWTYQIAGIPRSSLPDEDIEIAAYVDNRELKGRVWFEDFTDGDVIPIHAQLYFRYPLTNLTVKASLYSGGNLVAVVPMVDEGTRGDLQKQDGIYSTLIDLSQKGLKKLIGDQKLLTEKIRVEVDFNITEISIPAPYAHYETGTSQAMLQSDYAVGNKSAFTAWATGVINLSDRDRDDDRSKPRIDIPGFTGAIQVVPGGEGRLTFKIVNARPLFGQLRVSLGSGVSIKVEPGKSDDSETLGQTYTLNFTVQEDAKLGFHDLKVQFADNYLEIPGAVNVVKSDSGGGGATVGKLGYIITIVLVCISILIIYIIWKNRTCKEEE